MVEKKKELPTPLHVKPTGPHGRTAGSAPIKPPRPKPPVPTSRADLVVAQPAPKEDLDLKIDFEPDARASRWSHISAPPLGNKLLAPPVLGWGGDVERAARISWRHMASRVTSFIGAHRASIAIAGTVLGVGAILAGALQLVRAQGDGSKAQPDARAELASVAAPTSTAKVAVGATSGAAAPQLPTVQATRIDSPTTVVRGSDTNRGAASKATRSAGATASERASAAPTPRAQVVQSPPVEASLAPIAKPSPPPPSSPSDVEVASEFDRNAAMGVLRQAGDAARSCGSGAPSAGSVRVSVTFARTGRVADAHVEGPSGGIGECIAGKFRSLQVPPFRGSSVTVYKTVIF